MSAAGVPGSPSQPATGWYPNLDGLGLPRSLTNGMTQSFLLIYSLRDAVNQLAAAVSKLVRYGTHQLRTQTLAQASPDGALWFETDRGTVFYAARLAPPQTTRDWYYAGGVYTDLLTKRPTDLGDRDVGFLFLVVSPATWYRWNGSGWDTV